MKSPVQFTDKKTDSGNRVAGLVVALVIVGGFVYNLANLGNVPKSMTEDQSENGKVPTAMPAPEQRTMSPEELTYQETVRTAGSMPPLESGVAEEQFPQSGSIEWLIQYNPNTPLGEVLILDRSNIEKNKVVRIRDGFNQPVAQVYVRPGEGFRIMLPHGSYKGTIAMGDAWYGPEIHFGAAGRYLKMSSIESINGVMTHQILPGTPYDHMEPISGSNF